MLVSNYTPKLFNNWNRKHVEIPCHTYCVFPKMLNRVPENAPNQTYNRFTSVASKADISITRLLSRIVSGGENRCYRTAVGDCPLLSGWAFPLKIYTAALTDCSRTRERVANANICDATIYGHWSCVQSVERKYKKATMSWVWNFMALM